MLLGNWNVLMKTLVLRGWRMNVVGVYLTGMTVEYLTMFVIKVYSVGDLTAIGFPCNDLW